jgi:alpha-glucosidase
MQWSAGPNAGFTSGEPWLPVADDYHKFNVETEKDDPGGMLNLYQRLLTARAENEALRFGHYVPDYADEGVLAYVRETSGQRLLVALNFTDHAVTFQPKAGVGRVVVSTYPKPTEPYDREVVLGPNEGQVTALRR